MSRREDTHRSSLPHFFSDAIPPKALDGQYPHGRKSTGLNKRYETDEARRTRKRHEEAQRCSEKKKLLEDSKRDFRSCRFFWFLWDTRTWPIDTCDPVVETHDAHANISPEERHRRKSPCHGEYSNKGDQPCPYSLLKSTSFHSEDEDILFESPAYPNDLAERPLNPNATNSSESRRKPIPYEQPSTARGETSLPPPQAVESASPQLGLTRTDTYQSTDSDHSFSNIDLDDYLDEDYKDYEVVLNLKVPGHCRNGWPHRFS